MLYLLMASATPSKEELFGGDPNAGLALEDCRSCSSTLALQARYKRAANQFKAQTAQSRSQRCAAFLNELQQQQQQQ